MGDGRAIGRAAGQAGQGGFAGPGSAALVAFTDRTEIAWLRALRRGFRHCAVWVRTGDCWILHEALSHQTCMAVVPAAGEGALRAALRAAGYRVVRARIAAAPRRLAPPLPMSCVEATKRVLGIQSWRILTPWQLYRHLVRRPRKMHLTNNLIRNI
jgi:hypothetical protein